MDDPSSLPQTPAQPPVDPVYAQYAATVANPNISGTPSWTMSPETLAFMDKFNKGVDAGQINPYQPIGPGGRSPIGTALSWLPYDPRQQTFDSHQHFGPTYNDPVLGKLQSMWTEPSKSQHDFWHKGLGPTLFGIALSAIAGGAGSPWLGALFKGASSAGMGNFDPLGIGASFVPGGSLALGLARGQPINPIGAGTSLANLATRFGG